MRKLLLLLPLIALLTACQSKREICAKYASQQLNAEQAASKLGIQLPPKSDPDWQGYAFSRVSNYCDYYRN